jgi:hypothetical protein
MINKLEFGKKTPRISLKIKRKNKVISNKFINNMKMFLKLKCNKNKPRKTEKK